MSNIAKIMQMVVEYSCVIAWLKAKGLWEECKNDLNIGGAKQ